MELHTELLWTTTLAKLPGSCICKPEYTGANCEILKGKEIQATDNWNDDIGTNCADACTRGFLEIHTEEIHKESSFPGPGITLCCPSDVCAIEEKTVMATNGHAMLHLYALNGTQSFHIRFRQY
ncbi:hypothetical protein GPALN_010577 [Globodera pallida]|nr:hypothetical protein GPALN_010577 [Globodera pallida]